MKCAVPPAGLASGRSPRSHCSRLPALASSWNAWGPVENTNPPPVVGDAGPTRMLEHRPPSPGCRPQI